MKNFKLLSLFLHLLSCYTLLVHSQAGEGCPASCGNCQLNNVQSLQSIIQNVVNQTLGDAIENIQQQVDTIAMAQRELPGMVMLYYL